MTTTPITTEFRRAIDASGLPGRWFRRGDDLFRVRYQRRSPRGWIVTLYKHKQVSASDYRVSYGADGLAAELRWNGPNPPKWVEIGDGRSALGVYPTPEAAVDAAADARSLAACDERICTPAEFVKVRRDNRLARARA